MKKTIASMVLFFLSAVLFTISASAAQNDTVRVGLYYSGSSSASALISANLENAVGSGYSFGYYDSDRVFHAFGITAETAISMSQDTNLYLNSSGVYSTSVPSSGSSGAIGCYHLQMNQSYGSYSAAAAAATTLAATYGTAFPVYDNGTFAVRIGSYLSSGEAQAALDQTGIAASVNSGSSYTVTVTVTGTDRILFEYDGGGSTYLGVQPRSSSGKAQTWFKGYQYYGGFEYDRSASLSGGKINVINVVNIDDYVKGVITYEMSASWPAEALKAQAVCARTYALSQSKHAAKNFDVCATTNCQVYRGTSASTGASDAAVDATAGMCMYYGGTLIEADYYSSNGGASEDSENVWGTKLGYLRGKNDPYEATVSIPSYTYTKTYTAVELTTQLNNKGYSIGTVASVQPTYTTLGNIASIVFTDTAGKQVTVKQESCKTALGASSMHFTISGSGTTIVTPPAASSDIAFYINQASTKVSSLNGLYTISGSGTLAQYSGSDVYVITSAGKSQVSGGTVSSGTTGATTVTAAGSYTIQGAGAGHNVGMSQYGAYAMAKQGYGYADILNFYYTDITIQ